MQVAARRRRRRFCSGDDCLQAAAAETTVCVTETTVRGGGCGDGGLRRGDDSTQAAAAETSVLRRRRRFTLVAAETLISGRDAGLQAETPVCGGGCVGLSRGCGDASLQAQTPDFRRRQVGDGELQKPSFGGLRRQLRSRRRQFRSRRRSNFADDTVSQQKRWAQGFLGFLVFSVFKDL